VASVVLLITELAYGGTPRSLQALALGLRQAGHDVRVASLFSKDSIAFELEAAGIEVAGFEIERISPLVASWRLYRFLRRSRAELLHTFNFHANLIGRFVGAAAGVPVILASERSIESVKAPWRVWSDRLTWRLADYWTVNASAVAAVLAAREGVRPQRIELITTGVDTDAFAPRPRDESFRARHGVNAHESLIACVGRLGRYKGQEHAIAAFARLCRQRDDVRLLLVGDGRFRADLEAQAAPLGDRVIFTGALGDVRPALAASDVFLNPSDEEGMPGAVLEAMSMGIPVIATSVGGTPEVIVNAETGLLVPAHRPLAIASAVQRLLTDPELAKRCAENARRVVVADFSIARVVAMTDALYRRLTGGVVTGGDVV
jgi:glycosyltransferase involved in cell wall biosynthesis